jgi:hypothetical protein
MRSYPIKRASGCFVTIGAKRGGAGNGRLQLSQK